VDFFYGSQEVIFWTQPLRKLLCAVSFDMQTATPVGPLRSEGGHYDVASWPQSLPQRRQIGILLSLSNEEVKYSAVMPQGDLLGERQATHVRSEPLDLTSLRTQASLGSSDGGLGNINYGQFLEAPL
jgi:hypothetical protein